MVRAVKVVPLADEGYGGAGRSFGGSAGSGRRSSVMGKVPSLVFDLDDLSEHGQHPPAEAVDEGSVAEVQQKLHTLLEPWSEPGGCCVTSKLGCGCCTAACPDLCSHAARR